MKVILVRHGETLWNRDRRIQGFSDVSLSDRGRHQADCLARCLRRERIEAIVCSPLIRARETATAIGRFHACPIVMDPDLRELNQGDFEGKTYGEIETLHAPFLKQWLTDPASVVIPGGESLRQLQERAWRSFERITSDGKDTLLVSHSFTIITLLCRLRGFGLERFRETHVDIASKTFVQFENRTGVVLLLNDISHLKGNEDCENS